MGIDTYRSLYGDLTKLKGTPLLNAPSTVTDNELMLLLLVATESIERYCNRHFHPITTTRYFDGNGDDELLIPDLVAITTLKQDEGNAGTFATTWAATDYHLRPYNAEPTKPWGSPYTSITTNPSGTRKAFVLGKRNYEIVSKWGYRNYVQASGATTTADGYTAAVTTINLAAGGGTQLAVGQTIRIGVEDMLITAIATDALTVVRGINGTTATIIPASAETVSILRWPPPVEHATMIHAARLFQRTPWAEPFYGPSELDVDIRVLIDRYRALTA